MRGELPIVAVRNRRGSVAEIVRSRSLAIVSDRDLQAVAAFCAIGFLVAINVILRFPDFGGTVASLVTFP